MWRWEPDTGTIDARFDSQAEAEEWLTEHYPDLQDEGVGEVTLLEGDRVVYGPMSLDPA
ncbi:MAG TPA: hypothetical protein GXZ30_06880 [Propionibacterium sp.]|jgi:hypothetical protein|nr:hypothetical protein [Propionibacterium sp.]